MNKTLVQILSLFLLLLSTPAWASDGKAFVTYLEGTAFKSKDGKEWSPISKGDALVAGDSVKTSAGTRMELTLPDGSKVRFSEGTTFKLEKLLFTDDSGCFGIKGLFGRMWSKIEKFKKVSRFEIKTVNAVAGVKGTTFRMDVNEDTSSLVRVYEGEVRVGSLPKEEAEEGLKPKYVPGPKEVPGPHEVTREEWTYIVKSWQQITVSPKGIASKPSPFTPEEDTEEWVKWNQEMDSEKKE